MSRRQRLVPGDGAGRPEAHGGARVGRRWGRALRSLWWAGAEPSLRTVGCGPLVFLARAPTRGRELAALQLPLRAAQPGPLLLLLGWAPPWGWGGQRGAGPPARPAGAYVSSLFSDGCQVQRAGVFNERPRETQGWSRSSPVQIQGVGRAEQGLMPSRSIRCGLLGPPPGPSRAERAPCSTSPSRHAVPSSCGKGGWSGSSQLHACGGQSCLCSLAGAGRLQPLPRPCPEPRPGAWAVMAPGPAAPGPLAGLVSGALPGAAREWDHTASVPGLCH